MANLNITLEGKVCVCELNRPHAMNSIDPEMREELYAFYARIKEDDDIHVVIFTGAGDKAFCTGADLKKTLPDTNVSYAQQLLGQGDPGSAFKGLETDKPILCAVNGYALAGGTELLLACDIAIASENAKFGLTEVRRGTIPWGGSIQRLPRSIAKTDAMLLLLTGDTIDAHEALRMGLVSKVVPHAELMPTALAIGHRIANNAPLAVRAVKQLVTRGGDLPLVHALAVDKYMYGLLKDSEDRIEGRKAFAEKRDPVWKMK
ncbi:MAG: enoyl-CoA hydratase/isomerase family protein [Gammaproteobacteria bacterium]|nr:enoyl-CoA hydratase/isomerase family protein [Gammaproteobacteria bacterium]MBU1441927.1 enoyl-CoA hydratase/isomerase family protein [Gammaproteobacteria bacterium]MBU2287998.1 enoyl-CoA hydratase/isomerase family protein [Gammaproteobacteria bacterium]MBU2410971.1 enoyl-CoA hydratase/isomerase family protein [Gammaproteobacteria bacterium]